MAISDSDKKLITALQAELDTLADMRRKLYTRRPGCACLEDHLCAHHAAVYNELERAADCLARAIRQASRDE